MQKVKFCLCVPFAFMKCIFAKTIFFSQFPGFAYSNILNSMAKDVNSSYSSRISAKELHSYNANLTFSSFKSRSYLVILFSIGNYNHSHNILKLDVLPNFSFTTSETMHDYY